MTDSLFSQSFEQWSKRTGGDIHDWRAACEIAWDRIRKSPHWHGGKPCECGTLARAEAEAQN